MPDALSVVICTCGRPRELRACLASLLRQTVPPVEILVVRLEADEETEKVVEEFRSRFPPVFSVSQKEATGLGHARNLGWASATGEWIAFIDDDAVADTLWVETLIRNFRNGPTALGGQVRDLDSDRIVVDGTFSFRLRKTHWCPAGCNMAFHRSLLREVGGFDENLRYGFDDHDIGVKLTLAGVKVERVPDAVVRHRRSWGPQREGRDCPDPAQYAWSGAYLIAKFADTLGVGGAEHVARLGGLLLELRRVSRPARTVQTPSRPVGPPGNIRLWWEMTRGLVRGTFHGLRVHSETRSRIPARAGGRSTSQAIEDRNKVHGGSPRWL